MNKQQNYGILKLKQPFISFINYLKKKPEQRKRAESSNQFRTEF